MDGNRVQRLRGWRAAGEYRSKSGGAVEAEELVTGLPEVYGTAPAGRLPDPVLHGALLGLTLRPQAFPDGRAVGQRRERRV